MTSHRTAWLYLVCGMALLLASVFGWVSNTQAQGPTPTATPFPAGYIASPLEVAQAIAAWELTEHANSYDDGFGADTTCARCKSPMNWDPAAPAAEAALDCASCKRVPGEERPILEGSVPVAEEDWQHIGCPICHEPVGESYYVAASFWNQATGEYEPVERVADLCAHCHEGQHGFMVSEEVAADSAHPNWDCLDCHGPHGDSITCEDCHDPFTGEGAVDHVSHYTTVQCAACHDQGGLALWQDRDAGSAYEGTVVTIRFAHTLTSWPSHNLQTEVDCRRCHHALSIERPAIAQATGCDNASCHPQGAVLFWCPIFPQEPQP